MKQKRDNPSAPKRYTTKDYLSEQFLYGGEWATREQIIADLKTITTDQGLINRYLQGLNTARERGINPE